MLDIELSPYLFHNIMIIRVVVNNVDGVSVVCSHTLPLACEYILFVFYVSRKNSAPLSILNVITSCNSEGVTTPESVVGLSAATPQAPSDAFRGFRCYPLRSNLQLRATQPIRPERDKQVL